MCVFNTAKDFLAPVVGCKLVCCKFIRHHLIDSALDVIKEKEGVPGYMSPGTPSLGSYVVLSLFFLFVSLVVSLVVAVVSLVVAVFFSFILEVGNACRDEDVVPL